ncbi:MAG: FtsH protease activity modulator HflK [Desulfuromonadaceae bacterium]|nr:FtsH protease activity modulator HflK [Desulfuromonas sp.]MDY0184648.1 FtsH protease activity modulator HflK [Desulfuromonadaceae bacterium]
MSQNPWQPRQDPLEQALEALVKKIKAGGGPPKKLVLGIVLALVLLFGAQSAFYKVDTEETGVLLRLGINIGTAPPGLHLKIPFGVDRVILVKTGRVLKEEFGFRADTRSAYGARDYTAESLILTGDLNVTDLEWIVQYQIMNPVKYLFNIADPTATIRDLSEAVLRIVIGNSNVTDVLTTERERLAILVQKDLQSIFDEYDIGIRIITVKFQDVNPPKEVRSAFNEVNEAEQQRESLIFQAREQYNREVPKARGVARSQILEAQGYALERINMAEGEAMRFKALLAEYKKAPNVTRKRLYLERMEQILPEIKELYLIDKDGAGIMPLLPLGSKAMDNGGSR